MCKLNFLKKHKFLVLSFLFIAVRIALFNINIAEWGDSYDYLKAAEALLRGGYPLNSKRLPLFPLFLAVGLPFFEGLVWGKIVVLLASGGCLYFTYKLADFLALDLSSKWKLIATGLLFFNPVFLYWSIRVVSEPVFTFFVLWAFFYFFQAKVFKFKNIIFLAFLTAAASLIRYEGFLLFAVLFLGLVLRTMEKLSLGNFLRSVKQNMGQLGLFIVGFVLFVSPWFIRNLVLFGNLLYTPYAAEAQTYTLLFKEFLVFVAYLLFINAVPFAALSSFAVLKRKVLKNSTLKDWALYLFIGLDLTLIAYWKAAVPRLFFPLLPFFALFLVKALADISRIFSNREGGATLRYVPLMLSCLSLLLYVILGLKLRPHFLTGSQGAAVLVSGVNALVVIYLFFAVKNIEVANLLDKLFIGASFVSLIILDIAVLNNQREAFSTAVRAASFVRQFDEPVAYADETGVVSYILGENGEFCGDDLGEVQQRKWLESKNINLVLYTNEHYDEDNVTLEVVRKRSEFEKVKRYERVEGVDPFNKFFIRLGLFSERSLPVKYSEVYKRK